MAESFEKSLKFTNSALLFSGISIYPLHNCHLISFLNCLFYFNILWLYTDVFGEFFWLIDGIQVGKSFSELSLVAPCITVCLLSTAKTAPMFYYKDIAVNVIEKLRQMHPKIEENHRVNDKKYNTEDLRDIINGTAKPDAKQSEMIMRKIVKDSIRLLNFVSLLLYCSSVVVTVAFTTLPLLSMGYEYFTSGVLELQLPFLTKYFFNPFTKIMWPIMYFHQSWSTLIAACNTFGVDTFVYAFCTYAHMHFRILCHRFEHIVVSGSMSETRERLKLLVVRHQELIELVNQVEMLSSKSTLFNIITSSVLICLSAFNVVILDDGATNVAFFTFLLMSLSQISLLCLFGDLLMRSSTKVAEGIYKCRWYDTDPGMKRNVLIILMRAQKPCRLTAANFADLNLAAFTTILSRSWSYFALLRTVYK